MPFGKSSTVLPVNTEAQVNNDSNIILATTKKKNSFESKMTSSQWTAKTTLQGESGSEKITQQDEIEGGVAAVAVGRSRNIQRRGSLGERSIIATAPAAKARRQSIAELARNSSTVPEPRRSFRSITIVKSDEPLILSKKGVKIDLLRSLGRLIQSRDPLMTVSKMKAELIKPWCTVLNSLVEVLETSHSKIMHPQLFVTSETAIGPVATIFISYYPYNRFLEVLNAIEIFHDNLIKSNPDKEPCYWIDFCMKNLYLENLCPPNWWVTSYMEFLNDIGHTLIVLTPWDNIATFKYIWLLWDILVSKYMRLKLTIQLNTKDMKAFRQILRTNPDLVIRKICNIDIQTCESSYTNNDKENIIQAMLSTIGTSHNTTINAYINNIFRQWIMREIEIEMLTLEIVENHDYLNMTNTLKLLTCLASQGESLGHPSEAEVYLRKLVEVQDKMFGSTHVETIKSKVKLANSLQAQNKLVEAEDYFRSILSVREKSLGENNILTSESTNALAAILSEQGKSLEAEELYKTALHRYDLSKAGHNHDALLCSHNLAESLGSNGDIQESTNLHRKTLQGRRSIAKTLGPDPDVISSEQALAFVLHNEGQFQEAEAHFRNVYNGLEIIHRNNHSNSSGSSHGSNSSDSSPPSPIVLSAMKDLANNLRENKKFDEAYELYHNVFNNYEVLYGLDHPDTLAAAHDFAGVAMQLEKIDEVEILYRRIFSHKTYSLGAQDLSTKSSLDDLANILELNKKPEEAIAFLEKSLKIHEKNDGVNHPSTLTVAYKILCLYESTKKYEQADKLCIRILENQETLLGNTNNQTLFTIQRYGDILKNLERYEEAEVQYKRALNGRLHTLGIDHVDTLASFTSLLNLYKSLEKYSEQEVFYRNYITNVEEILGVNHSSTVNLLLQLGKFLKSRGLINEAESIYREVLARRLVVPGKDTVEVADIQSLLGDLLVDQERYNEAEEFYKHALVTKQTLNGDRHPSTVSSLRQLALLYDTQNDYIHAEPIHYRILAIREATNGLDHMNTFTALSSLVTCLHDQNKLDSLELLYIDLLAKRKNKFGSNHPLTKDCASKLIDILTELGKVDAAKEIYESIKSERIIMKRASL